MARTSQLIVLITFVFPFSTGFAEQPDTLWMRLLKENTWLLQPNAAGFTAKGWDLILAGVKDNH